MDGFKNIPQNTRNDNAWCRRTPGTTFRRTPGAFRRDLLPRAELLVRPRSHRRLSLVLDPRKQERRARRQKAAMIDDRNEGPTRGVPTDTPCIMPKPKSPKPRSFFPKCGYQNHPRIQNLAPGCRCRRGRHDLPANCAVHAAPNNHLSQHKLPCCCPLLPICCCPPDRSFSPAMPGCGAPPPRPC